VHWRTFGPLVKSTSPVPYSVTVSTTWPSSLVVVTTNSLRTSYWYVVAGAATPLAAYCCGLRTASTLPVSESYVVWVTRSSAGLLVLATALVTG
jgi:hypothetical protein